MIHDIRPEYFTLPLERYRLTFDDGLYSQYYYLPRLREHPEPLTFFVTTGFIQPGPARGRNPDRPPVPLKSKKYMYRTFFEGRRDHFMTVEEVQEIARQPGVRIGAHSHFHDVVLTDRLPRKPKPPSAWKKERFADFFRECDRNVSVRSRLAFRGFNYIKGRLVPRSRRRWEDDVRDDTQRCLQWFEEHLGFAPRLYCFPFNEYTPELIDILEEFGFREFFGARSSRDARIQPRLDIDGLLAG